MFTKIKGIPSSIISELSEAHLRKYHKRMALDSLKELRSNCKLTKQEKNSIREYWKRLDSKCEDSWHRLYKKVNGFDRRYVPNDVYGLEIITRLNSTSMLSEWDDKSYYPRFFPDVKQPDFIGCCIDGCFYDADYRLVNRDFLANNIIERKEGVIVKPSFGLEGRGVQFWKELNLEELKSNLLHFGNNFVIQEPIKQHSSLAAYNYSSVNPIRVMTLRLNGKIHYLHSTLRFGTPGSITDINFVDNKEVASVCAISDRGEVATVFYDLDGHKESITKVGIDFANKIPDFQKVIDMALFVHSGLHHFDLIGCDISVTSDGEPVLIEYNVYWPGIIIPQFCHGPLFGDLTEEVMFTLQRMPKK